MSVTNLVYEFAKTDGGNEMGFNDSVTTTFKGHPAYSLARESIQNIIDAVDDATKPVIAEFSLNTIKSHELPSFNQLEKVMDACKKYYFNYQPNIDFFSKAQNILKKNEEINILTISDYNTIGMPGDDDDINGNYYNFLRSDGASQKTGGTGGSFGLGKGAYYAASSFHTIFVSSIYGNNEHVFQGKLRLVTHKVSGEKHQAIGSFGYPKQRPVRNEADIPTLFKRTVKGTNISIIGFTESDNWENAIFKSVLSNFWLAIFNSKLIVRVGKEEITARTLEKFMFKYFQEYDKDNEEKPNPLQYYLAHVSPQSTFFVKSFPILGELKLWVMVKDNYSKRIAYFRSSGMQIKKDRFPLPKQFAAVFVCDNAQGNEILRAMENPQHNQWDPENAREKTDIIYNNAKKAEKEIREFVRSSLQSILGVKNQDELDMPGLSNHLFYQTQLSELQGLGLSPENSPAKEPLVETPREIGVESTKKFPLEISHQIKVIKKESNIDKGHKKVIRNGNGGGSGNGNGGGAESLDGKMGSLLADVQLRSYAFLANDGLVWHQVIVKGKPGIKVNLFISAGTDDAFDPLNIVKAADSQGRELKWRDNSVSGFLISESGIGKLVVRFHDNEKYALNVLAYENK